MGFVILTIVGAVMGWLASLMMNRNERAGTAACAMAGLLGAFAGARLVGSVPLSVGVSAGQLLCAALSAGFSILVVTILALRRKTAGTQ